MKHTYVLEPGKWKAEGNYYDESGKSILVVGETEISHQKEVWTLDGFMELQLDEPIRFFNTYSIIPIETENDFTSWSSENPALGTLNGHFAIVGDTILSSYRSENEQYTGAESLLLIDPKSYKNWGVAFHNGVKLSSWEVYLTKL